MIRLFGDKYLWNDGNCMVIGNAVDERRTARYYFNNLGSLRSFLGRYYLRYNLKDFDTVKIEEFIKKLEGFEDYLISEIRKTKWGGDYITGCKCVD